MAVCLLWGLQIRDEGEPLEVMITELNTWGLISRVEVHNGPYLTFCG